MKKILLKDLPEYAYNFLDVEVVKNKYLYFHRFTKEQRKLYEEDIMFESMSLSSAGVYLAFKTNSNKLKIKVKKDSSFKLFFVGLRNMGLKTVIKEGIEAIKTIKKYDGKTDLSTYFDLLIDDKIVQSKRFKGKSVKFKDFNKNHLDTEIKIFLPNYFRVGIKSLKYKGYIKKNTNNNEKVLSLGDSITQGFNGTYPSLSYVSRISLMYHLDIVNQGVGGYYYDYRILENLKFDGYKFVTIAYGTNDFPLFNDLNIVFENIRLFYATYAKLYGNIPTIVISPIWRPDYDLENNIINDIREFIKLTVSKYENMIYVNGLDLVPNETSYYSDGYLHPNYEGFNHMANNLKEYIDEILKRGKENEN